MIDAAENRRVLTAVFAETARGNGRPFVEALAETVEWTIIGSTAWSRLYSGKRAVLAELLGPLGAQLEGANTIVADRIVVEGDIAVVEGHGENRTRRGKPYRNRYCWIIRMAGGLMTQITEYTDTQLIAEALDAPAMG